LPPTYTFVPSSAELRNYFLFMFSNLFLGQMAATQKNANESLRGARDELN
jgi:hypothetical protein